MTIDEANKLVNLHVVRVDGFAAVTRDNALSLLGSDRLAALLKDPIRRFGPSADTIYPWNVVDALWQPNILR